MLPVLLLQIANFFSGLANSIVVITIPWLVLEVTDSPTFAGLVVALSSIPSLIISPFGGVIIDKLGKRVVSVGADVLSMLSVIAFPIFAVGFGLSGIAILLLALLGAIFDPLGYTARKTLIADVSAKSRFDIDRLNGIHEGLFGVSWIAGPAIGAWLIAWIGSTNSFWFAGGCFLVAALAIALLRVSISKPGSGEPTEARLEVEKSNFLTGFRLIWRDRLLKTILIAVLVLAAVYLPTESVILPAYFESLNEPTSLGLVISLLAGGSAVSALGYGWIVKRMSGRALLRLAFIGASLGTLAMSLLPPLPILLIAAFLLGLSWGPFNPFLNSLIQQRVSSENQAQVFGAQTAFFYAAPPLGMVISGLVVETFGISTAYQSLAWTLMLTSLIALATPALRDKF